MFYYGGRKLKEIQLSYEIDEMYLINIYDRWEGKVRQKWVEKEYVLDKTRGEEYDWNYYFFKELPPNFMREAKLRRILNINEEE